jgi:IclR family transcriptional regulator, pca regulon regulatory protein
MSYRVEALSKGLRLLRLFDENRPTLRLKDAAELTGIPLPTVFRLASTLEEDGFLERRPDGSYAPGVAVLTLGSAAVRSSSLVQLCEAPLRELATATSETVNLGVLAGDRVLYLVRLRNADLVTANIQVGSTLPAVYTSMGKVLLAALTPAELAARISPGSFTPGAGPNAMSTLDELDLDRVRAEGYAIQDEELAQGLRSVAAPVIDKHGRTVAAVNIAVNAGRHDTATLHGPFREQLLATTTEITERMRQL